MAADVKITPTDIEPGRSQMSHSAYISRSLRDVLQALGAAELRARVPEDARILRTLKEARARVTELLRDVESDGG